MEIDDALFSRALAAAQNSYSPYSRFRVGAAILCDDGEVFTGTNVENRSFGLTICAERSALVAAVSAGKHKFRRIAIATPDASYPVSPCGACRQVLSEFFPAEAEVEYGNEYQNRATDTIGGLLPHDSLHDLAH